MTCPTCATTLPDDANYCSHCGRLVRIAPPAGAGSRMPGWVIALIVVGALFVLGIPFFAIVAAILIPNFIHARAESQMAADQANLKSIATALEEYAVDHRGRYPDRLTQLTPTYLKTLPEVPGTDSAGAYTYHHPASRKAAYDIWDDGSMDPTTFGSLPRGVGGPTCAAGCKYVVYVAGAGLVGLPGSTP
jgi:Tfp pilus assembly protein PilE